MQKLGTHLIVDFSSCDSKVINDFELIKKSLLKIVDMLKVTKIDEIFHKFSPKGVTGVVAISESHLSIHTWPEKGYVAVDFFTCGEIGDTYLHKAANYLKKIFKATQVKITILERGF